MATITEKAILIRLTKNNPPSLSPQDLEKQTSYCWRFGAKRQQAEYAFAIHKGIILQVYKIQSWHQVPNAPSTLPQDIGRWEFKGVIATNKQHYIGQIADNGFEKQSSHTFCYRNI